MRCSNRDLRYVLMRRLLCGCRRRHAELGENILRIVHGRCSRCRCRCGLFLGRRCELYAEHLHQIRCILCRHRGCRCGSGGRRRCKCLYRCCRCGGLCAEFLHQVGNGCARLRRRNAEFCHNVVDGFLLHRDRELRHHIISVHQAGCLGGLLLLLGENIRVFALTGCKLCSGGIGRGIDGKLCQIPAECESAEARTRLPLCGCGCLRLLLGRRYIFLESLDHGLGLRCGRRLCAALCFLGCTALFLGLAAGSLALLLLGTALCLALITLTLQLVHLCAVLGLLCLAALLLLHLGQGDHIILLMAVLRCFLDLLRTHLLVFLQEFLQKDRLALLAGAIQNPHFIFGRSAHREACCVLRLLQVDPASGQLLCFRCMNGAVLRIFVQINLHSVPPRFACSPSLAGVIPSLSIIPHFQLKINCFLKFFQKFTNCIALLSISRIKTFSLIQSEKHKNIFIIFRKSIDICL